MLGNKKVVGEKYFAKWTISTGFKKKIAFNSDASKLICITMDGNYLKVPIIQNGGGENPTAISE